MPGTTKKAHQAERLLAIRLRYCINTHLDEQGLTAAPDIARAVDLIMREQPALVVLGGDYVSLQDRRYMEPCAEALAPLELKDR